MKGEDHSDDAAIVINFSDNQELVLSVKKYFNNDCVPSEEIVPTNTGHETEDKRHLKFASYILRSRSSATEDVISVDSIVFETLQKGSIDHRNATELQEPNFDRPKSIYIDPDLVLGRDEVPESHCSCYKLTVCSSGFVVLTTIIIVIYIAMTRYSI